MEARIAFKLLLLVYKCVVGKCSSNLQIKYKTYNCRSNDYLMLKPANAKTVYGKRTFDYAGARLWNALPVDVRTLEDIEF